MARVLLMLLGMLCIGWPLDAQYSESEPPNRIIGALQTDYGVGIQHAKIILSEQDGSLLPVIVTTDDSGHFSITGLTQFQSFYIQPQKLGADLNGVDIWDLYQLEQAISFSQFSSPYQKLAADINNDAIISSKDYDALRACLLGDDSQNLLWHFYDAQCLPPLSDPFGTCSESIDYVGDHLPLDFVGVKVGDLNGSATSNELQTLEYEYGQLVLSIHDQDLSANKEYDVTVSLDNEDIVGRQFSLDLGSLELLDVLASGVSILDQVGLRENNVITFADVGASAQQELTLRVRARVQSKLSEILSLATTISSAKVYDLDGEMYGLKIDFGGNLDSQLMLYQNNPNPFGDVTEIRFYLPSSTTATLIVFNPNGQRIKTIEGFYPKGMNSVSISKEDLHQTGIYFYKLATDEQIAIRKMMLIGD